MLKKKREKENDAENKQYSLHLAYILEEPREAMDSH
jgi:hypothetical protein